MTHTTPPHARAIANQLKGIGLNGVAEALRSLADQLEAVTADCERFANQTFKAKAEAKTLVDRANAERDAYKLDAGRYNYILECECKAVKTYLGDIDFDAHKNIIRSKHDAAIAKEAK